MISQRPVFTYTAATVAVVGTCSVARANSLSPYAYFLPGVVSISVIYSFPASLLAAFIERPFLAAAGIARRSFVLSLKANLVSTLVGLLLIPVGYPALYTIGPLWCLVAFSVSCVVEVYHLRKYAQCSVSTRWVVAANACSSLVLICLPVTAAAIEQRYPLVAWSLSRHADWLGWALSIASIITFLASYLWPVQPVPKVAPNDSGEKIIEADEAV